jgi:hypothetical protein
MGLGPSQALNSVVNVARDAAGQAIRQAIKDYDTVAVAWVAQVSADALAWQTCNHTLAAAGQAEADGNASALESYVDSCVVDLVTYMNAAVNAANVLAKAGSAADVTAISGWAANANTYDLAVIATNLPLKQALATAVEAWDKAYADAALDEANAEWPDWLWYTTTVNGKIAAFYTNMAGKRKDYLAAVDAALETAKLDMAPIDHQLAADLARAHQASYNQAMGFSTDEMIQVAQEQLNATSARPPSDFAWLSEPMDIESSAIPITGWYIYIGIHESAQMSLESTAQAYGVSFEGHHWAPNTIAAPAAPPYNGPSFGSMYWHYLTNPSEMDGWVYYANNVAYGMIGIGMGGLAGIGAGIGIGAVGAWAGSGATATSIAAGLIGGMVGGKVGGAIGGVAGNLGGWIGGVGGGIIGGWGAADAASGMVPPPVPGSVQGIRGWWYRGAENDATWRALSPVDKFFWEIGNNTMPKAVYEAKYAALDPVRCGRAMIRQWGWRGGLPQGRGWFLGLGETFRTGPTAVTRYLLPTLTGATVGAIEGVPDE